jgi:hypothetical protein
MEGGAVEASLALLAPIVVVARLSAPHGTRLFSV